MLHGDDMEFKAAAAAIAVVVVLGAGQVEAVIFTGLGDLPGGSFLSNACSVSADGSVVLGYSHSASGYEAFRWTSSGMVGLGDLPGGSVSTDAQGVSADGSATVENGASASGADAFGWTSGGVFGPGDLLGDSFSGHVYGMSADGSVVVGSKNSASGTEAFVWNASDGMRSLKDVLTSGGLDLTGWRLTEARAVSDDGRTIVGSGSNPDGYLEAWMAKTDAPIPEPSSLIIWSLLGVLGITVGWQRRGKR